MSGLHRLAGDRRERKAIPAFTFYQCTIPWKTAPGTLITGTENGLLLNGQAFGGYIDTKSGRRLVFNLVVNNVSLGDDVQNVLQVFQDQGIITAIIWRDN